MNCEHGRKPWKCTLCKRAELTTMLTVEQPTIAQPPKEYDAPKKYDAYDGLRSIFYLVLGFRPTPEVTQKVAMALCRHGNLTKCRPYSADPSLIQLTFGRGEDEYIKLIPVDVLRRIYYENLASKIPTFNTDFADVEKRVAAGLTNIESGRITYKNPADVFLINRPNAEIKVSCRATLIIGNDKYLIRFEGEKGHIFKC